MQQSGGATSRLRWLIVLGAIIGLLSPSLTSAATLGELLNRQSQLQKEQQQKEALLKQKQQQEVNLNSALENINGHIEYTQGRISNTENQISVTSSVISQLDKEIAENQKQYDTFQGRLRAAYVVLYELSRTNSTELITQGEKISQIVSQGMYVQSIQDQLQIDIDRTSKLLAELNGKKEQTQKQKSELDSLKERLAYDKSLLDRQRYQRERSLVATQQDQAKLEVDLKKLEQQREVVGQQIYELRRRQTARFADGGTGGYPYAGNCGVVDRWLYYSCQCTSYAAWKFLSYYGLPFDNTRPGSGSAYNWPNLARDQGYTVSSVPRANTLVSWSKSASSPQYGHAAWVTRVHQDGTIDVAEYNFRVREGYGERYGINPNDPFLGSPTYIYP